MSEKIAENFGKRIRAMRMKRGWRQDDLAAHAKTSRQHVSDIELAKTDVCIRTIGRLATALEVEAFELFR